MSNGILKFKGMYRILPTLDERTNNFIRKENGDFEDIDLFIKCAFGNKIYYYGHGTFVAYIPSLKRGHRIVTELDELQIPYSDYMENDSEIEFRFNVKYMDEVASLLKAQVSGAGISPYSKKNLPKSDIEIPSDKIALYKAIIAPVPSSDLLLLSRWTTEFLSSELIKKYRRTDKNFDLKSDMRKMKLGRQTKEYIFIKGEFENYLRFLEKKIGEKYGKVKN